jgi:DNA polymerase-3 subunit gamma/tau
VPQGNLAITDELRDSLKDFQSMSSDSGDKDYLVLARKYRPQTFGELVGQDHVVDTLRNAITMDRIAHAFLFTGIRGVGKTTAARLLAKALNCLSSDGPTPDPCDTCSNCVEIRESRSIDVAEIDGASNRGIDSIRELTDNVRYQPLKSRFRVYIIDEAHMVTREGFNALLKTLEEPPAHVKFIFATTAVDKFPETIVSRCQRYDFKRIPLARIKHELARIAEREGVTLSDEALFAIAREGQGSMRDAESLLERMIAFSGRAIDDAKVGEILGIADRKTVFEAADAVLRRDAKRALEVVDAVYRAGRDLERFSSDLLEHWRNLVVTKLGAAASVLSDVPPNEIDELCRQAELRERVDLERLFRIARLGDEELAEATVPRLVLEMTVVRMATLEPVLPVDGVLARLDEIEKSLARAPAARASRPVSSSAPAPESPSGRQNAVAETTTAAPPTVPRQAQPEAVPTVPPEAVRTAVIEPARPTANNGSDDGDGRWSELLGFVQTRKLGLYLTLTHARFVAGGAGQLVLGVAKEKFRSELSSRTTQSQLEAFASEFYGAPTRIRIEAASEEAPPVTPPPTPHEMLEHPSVKAAVEILGGEVREIRPRR